MSDPFERNLEQLIQRAALPVRPDMARREFLRRLEPRPPRRLTMMAASILACAAILWSAWPPQSPPVTPTGSNPGIEEKGKQEPIQTPKEWTAAPTVVPPRAPAPVFVPTGKPARSGEMTLSYAAPSLRDAAPKLRIEGQVSLPEKAILMVRFYLTQEVLVRGRLESRYLDAASALVQVRSEKFEYAASWTKPGPGLVTAELFEDQDPAVQAILKKRPTPGPWSFQVGGWSDDLAGQLVVRRLEIDTATREALDFITIMEKACATKEAWEADKKKLGAEARKLQARAEALAAARFFPATQGQIASSLRDIVGSLDYYRWIEGKLQVVVYHSGDEPAKTFRGDAFSFPTLRGYVAEAAAAADRELALWMVKDLRRGTAAHADVLKYLSTRPGFADLGARLEKGDLDAIERELRVLP